MATVSSYCMSIYFICWMSPLHKLSWDKRRTNSRKPINPGYKFNLKPTGPTPIDSMGKKPVRNRLADLSTHGFVPWENDHTIIIHLAYPIKRQLVNQSEINTFMKTWCASYCQRDFYTDKIWLTAHSPVLFFFWFSLMHLYKYMNKLGISKQAFAV